MVKKNKYFIATLNIDSIFALAKEKEIRPVSSVGRAQHF